MTEKKANGNGAAKVPEDAQTLETIRNAKVRAKFDRLCKQIREQKDAEKEAKETASVLMDDAKTIAAKYRLTKLYAPSYLWLKTAGRKGQIKEALLQQELLKAGLDIDEVKKVIEASRGKDSPDYYQVRAR